MSFSQSIGWENYVTTSDALSFYSDSSEIWVGTWGGGAFRFNRKTGVKTHFRKDNSNIPYMNIKDINKDNKGNVWFGFSGGGVHTDLKGGLAKYDGKNWTKYDTSNSGIGSNYITRVKFDSQNNLWVSSRDKGGCLAKYDGKKWISFNSINSGIPYGGINDFVFDSLGKKVFVATFNGLGILDVDSSKMVYLDSTNSPFPGRACYDLELDKKGNLLLCSDVGFVVLDKNYKWTVYNSKNTNGLVKKSYNVVVDYDNNYWVAAYDYNWGLLKYDGKTWSDYKKSNNKAPVNFFDHVFYDKIDSSIYISSLSKGWVNPKGSLFNTDTSFYKFKNNKWQGIVLSEHTVSEWSFIALDKNGKDLWIFGYDNYIDLLSNGILTKYPIKDSIGIYDSYSCSDFFVQDTAGNLWLDVFASSSYALYKFDTKTKINHVYNSTNSPLPSGKVNGLRIGKKGSLYVLSSNGIGTFDGNTWNPIVSPPGILVDIEEDYDGNLWVSTSSGVYKIDKSKSIAPTLINGTNGKACGLTVDMQNNIWFILKAKLFKYDPKKDSLISYVLPEDLSYQYSLTRVSDIKIDTDGQLWISSGNNYGGGLYQFDGSCWYLYDMDNSGITDDGIGKMEITTNNKLYMAAYGSGINVFDLSYKKVLNCDVLATVEENTNIVQINKAGFLFGPNPTNNLLNVYTKDLGNLEISDMSGQLLHKQQIENQSQQIDISDLKSGTYLYRFTTIEGVKFGKVVKQ